MATQNLGRVRFAPQGAWNSATSYSFFDLVSHQGAAYAYVAVWQLVAVKGEAGENGAAGAQGPAGDKGDKPAHQWSGPSLRFETPTGSWGGYVNLRGPQGPQGPAGGSNCNCGNQ